MKKGQSSLEYLTNYMWAFMLFLLFIGVMMYFDMFNMERYSSAYCRTDANFVCSDFNLLAIAGGNSFTINIYLQNNMNDDVWIQNARLFEKNESEITCQIKNIYCRYNETDFYATTGMNHDFIRMRPGEWTPTRVCKVSFNNCFKNVVPGSKEEILYFLNFSGVNSAETHVSYGSIFAVVQ
ncbi:hypothetical protein ISS09_02025 [Candidatus Woesearchaeota archaeon]|nr:hypothetical protein [Candidatus Woesearchaeota archaeon]